MNAIIIITTGALKPADETRVRAALEASTSANTRQAYRQAWAGWQAWAASRGASVLPAKPADVAA